MMHRIFCFSAAASKNTRTDPRKRLKGCICCICPLPFIPVRHRHRIEKFLILIAWNFPYRSRSIFLDPHDCLKKSCIPLIDLFRIRDLPVFSIFVQTIICRHCAVPDIVIDGTSRLGIFFMSYLRENFLNRSKGFYKQRKILFYLRQRDNFSIPIHPHDFAIRIPVQTFQIGFQIELKTEFWQCRSDIFLPSLFFRKQIGMSTFRISVMCIGVLRGRRYIFDDFYLLADHTLQYTQRFFSCPGILIGSLLPRVCQCHRDHIGIIPYQAGTSRIDICLCPRLFYPRVIAGTVHLVAGKETISQHCGFFLVQCNLLLFQYRLKSQLFQHACICFFHAKTVGKIRVDPQYVSPICIPGCCLMNPFCLRYLPLLCFCLFPVNNYLDRLPIRIIRNFPGFVIDIYLIFLWNNRTISLNHSICLQKCRRHHLISSGSFPIISIRSKCVPTSII